VPYRQDQYAGAMHPAKLNEYLVFGLPVVATATPELLKLATEWPEKMLYLASTPEEFVQVAAKAISEDSLELRQRRQLVTRNQNWNNRVEDLKGILDVC
jgi:glycosyltransferase involved in cell wall biosynthesis